MRLRTLTIVLSAACALALAGCRGGGGGANSNAGAQNQPTPQQTPGPLPENGFVAQLTLVEPPARLRAGQKETVQVRLKNASQVFWWARGAEFNDRQDNMFYIAAGNRWLKPDGSLLTNMDGRYGISANLKPGEETEIPLGITAPKEPGEYTLEVDLVQEGVAWFSDKGSPTAKAKVTVVR
jgi:hypothetical protein